MQELPFLHSARRLTFIDICMKVREDSLMGFQVTERTRFVTNKQTGRRTDGQTDARGKNNMSPNPEGGRHKYEHLGHSSDKTIQRKCYKVNTNFWLQRRLKTIIITEKGGGPFESKHLGTVASDTGIDPRV